LKSILIALTADITIATSASIVIARYRITKAMLRSSWKLKFLTLIANESKIRDLDKLRAMNIVKILNIFASISLILLIAFPF